MSRKLALSSLFIVLCLLGSPLFLGTPQVRAAESPDFLKITLSRIFGLRGQNFNLTSSSTFAQVTVSIADPKGALVYSQSWPGNSSRIIPIGSTAEYGTYTITASAGTAKATALFTVLDVSSWSSVTFPYIVSHQGLNFTFFSNYTILVSDADSSMVLDFTVLRAITSQLGLGLAITKNSMNFRCRLQKSEIGVAVDLTFAFIHSGCKIIINGTLDQPRTIDFTLGQIQAFKSTVDGLRLGHIIFDWGDLKRAGADFAFNSTAKTLTVHVPKTFTIDPAIFSDGFESGDFSAWTGTYGTGYSTLTVVSDWVHHGIYSAKVVSDEYECYPYNSALGSANPKWLRGYFKSNSPSSGGSFMFIGLGEYVGHGWASAEAGIKNDGGTVKWIINYYLSDGWHQALGSSVSWDSNHAYCVELKVNRAVSGETRLYVDGVEVVTVTGVDLTARDILDTFVVGCAADHAGGTQTTYFDCVVVDTSYIGPEATNTAPTIGSFAAPSTAYANKYEFINVTVNDVEGKTDLSNATIQIGSAQFSWVNSTNTFSEAADPSNYWTLDAANSVKTDVNTTAVRLAWKLKGYWNATEGPINVNGTVYDSAAASGTGSSTGLFSFTDNLIISSVTHLPGQPAAGQQITLTGQIYYEGTSTPPEDPTGITVYAVRNTTATQVGSTSTVTAGAFSMSWQEGTEGTYGYDVYCVTDEASTQNRTEIIYVEKGSIGTPVETPSDSFSQNSTDNSGSSSMGPGWTLPVGFNLAAPILIFSCLVAIVCYDAYEKDFSLSGTSKSWSKRKRNKKTEWKEKKPWD